MHIFGDEPTLASSRLLLVYGHRGGINCLLHRNINKPAVWENFEIPEEYTGYAVKPSLRLCFDTREACVEAMTLFDSLRTAHAAGTSLLPDAEVGKIARQEPRDDLRPGLEDEQPVLTTCVLLYGDFPSLARRCLRSIDPYVYRIQMSELGRNACGAMTKEIVAEFAERHSTSFAR